MAIVKIDSKDLDLIVDLIERLWDEPKDNAYGGITREEIDLTKRLIEGAKERSEQKRKE